MIILVWLVALYVAVVFVLAFLRWLIRGLRTGNFSGGQTLEEILRDKP